MTVFQCIQIAVLLAFIAVISDFRRKAGMTPLVCERLTRIVKSLYMAPIGIYAYVLFRLERVLATDYAAFGLAVLGALVVIKAKLDLGRHHTWAGYHLAESEMVTTGIYGYIRHPLYAGIIVFIAGALTTIVAHAPWFLTGVVVGTVSYIALFLAIAASRETESLLRRYGDSFSSYTAQVHPFLPIRRFREG